MRHLLLSAALGLGALGLSLATPARARADTFAGPAYISSGYTPVAYYWRGGNYWRGNRLYRGYGFNRGWYPYRWYGGYGGYYPRYYGSYYPWRSRYFGFTPYFNYGYYYPGYFW